MDNSFMRAADLLKRALGDVDVNDALHVQSLCCCHLPNSTRRVR